MSTAGGPRIRLPQGSGGNAASILPTGQSFDRVSTIVLGTERGNIAGVNRAKNPNIISYFINLNSLQNEINNLNSLLNSSKLDPQKRQKILNELKRILKIVNNMKVPLYSNRNPNLQVVLPSSPVCNLPTTPSCVKFKFQRTAFGPFTSRGNPLLYKISNNPLSPFYSPERDKHGQYKGEMELGPDIDFPTIVTFNRWWVPIGSGGVGVARKVLFCLQRLDQRVGKRILRNAPAYYIGRFQDSGDPVPGYLTLAPSDLIDPGKPCFSRKLIETSQINYYTSCNDKKPTYSTCGNGGPIGN